MVNAFTSLQAAAGVCVVAIEDFKEDVARIKVEDKKIEELKRLAERCFISNPVLGKSYEQFLPKPIGRRRR